MEYRIIYGVIFLLIISNGMVFAEESIPLISINTDKKNYNEGDVIIVSGKVSTIIGETPITLQIFTNESLLEIAQITVSKDGTFSHTVFAEGKQWKNEGEYIIRILYGERNNAETKFNYVPKSVTMKTTKNFEVNIKEHGTFDLKYTIIGGIINDIIIDSDILGLKIEIDAENDGIITLDLPREFIGAEKQNGKDEMFIILIDGIEVPYKESITFSESRIITIDFQSGDSNIEIIGTYVIPEFGTITIIILMVGIMSVILITKNRFQLSN